MFYKAGRIISSREDCVEIAPHLSKSGSVYQIDIELQELSLFLYTKHCQRHKKEKLHGPH